MEITSKKSLLGMSQETSEGLSAKKNYSSPSIKVVEFVVERGMTASNPQMEGSLTFRLTSTNTASQVPSASGWNVDEGWFTRSTQQ